MASKDKAWDKRLQYRHAAGWPEVAAAAVAAAAAAVPSLVLAGGASLQQGQAAFEACLGPFWAWDYW